MATNAVPAGSNITLLTFDVSPGGYSPFLCRLGKSIVNMVAHAPKDARLLEALAAEPSAAVLDEALQDDGQSTQSASLIIWILFILALALLLLGPPGAWYLSQMLPVAATTTFIVLAVGFIFCQGALLMLIISIFGTRSNMARTLKEEMPDTYSWIFETLSSYVVRTSRDMIRSEVAADPGNESLIQERILADMTDTQASLNLIRANLSHFDEKFHVFADVKSSVDINMLAVIPLVPAVLVSVAACFFGCVVLGNTKRKRNMHREIAVMKIAVLFVTAGVFLLIYSTSALPFLASLIPECILGHSYICRPFYTGDYAVLDDGMQRLWPTDSRREPYSRLVPSEVIRKCGEPGISVLQLPQHGTSGTDSAGTKRASSNATDYPIGNCVVVNNVITSGMTTLCAMFVDDLLGHWVAHAVAVVVCFLAAIFAFLLAAILLGQRTKRKRRTKYGRKGTRTKSRRRPSSLPTALKTQPKDAMVQADSSTSFPAPHPKGTESTMSAATFVILREPRPTEQPTFPPAPTIILSSPPLLPPPPPIIVFPPAPAPNYVPIQLSQMSPGVPSGHPNVSAMPSGYPPSGTFAFPYIIQPSQPPSPFGMTPYPVAYGAPMYTASPRGTFSPYSSLPYSVSPPPTIAINPPPQEQEASRNQTVHRCVSVRRVVCDR
ncbi:uncharacterized protein LOC135369515 [Ornithodoros turicata]|uniref:uncharacterized protein LOC135369515 n=1 Tax=Ornithodoros turicata TaxID=34597 RepID=UPI0031397DDC